MSEVKLEKADWEEAKKSTISLLKNAMAQVVVYQNQLDCAEQQLLTFPVESPPPYT